MRVNFIKFQAWQKKAAQQGCSICLVTRSKKNKYYQARSEGSVVGFFNTGLKGGALSVKCPDCGGDCETLLAALKTSLAGGAR